MKNPIIFFILIFPTIAGATTPASDAQLLCGSQDIFLGHVLNAKSADCRLTITKEYPDSLGCMEMNNAFLSVKILKVIAHKRDGFQKEPKTEDIKLNNILELPVEVSPRSMFYNTVSDPFDVQGRLSRLKPANEVFADDEAEEIFKGKDFYFANRRMWRFSKKDWIYSVLKNDGGHSCPKLEAE